MIWGVLHCFVAEATDGDADVFFEELVLLVNEVGIGLFGIWDGGVVRGAKWDELNNWVVVELVLRYSGEYSCQ